MADRRRIVVLNTFPVYPPKNGGQSGIYYRYLKLSKYYDVTLICTTDCSEKYSEDRIAENFVEISIPISRMHARFEQRIEGRASIPVRDIAMPLLIHLTPEYKSKALGFMRDSDVIVAAHPYLFNIIPKGLGRLVVYESHNAEYVLKERYLHHNLLERMLLKVVKHIEGRACRESDLILAVTESAGDKLSRLYGIDESKICVIPSGVDVDLIKPSSEDKRLESKVVLGFGGQKTIVFVGSWHPPNLDALKFILKLARSLPAYRFLVIGSVKDQMLHEKKKVRIPENVTLYGSVDEDKKLQIYAASDIAINPMEHCSGINLKMLEYMAAGIPVITTYSGASGIDVENGREAIISRLEDFEKKIVRLLYDSELRSVLSEGGRSLVERKFSWTRIGEKIHGIYEKELDKRG